MGAKKIFIFSVLISVKSSQNRVYRRERNFTRVFFDDQEASRDKTGFFGALQTLAWGRAVTRASFKSNVPI